MFVAEEAVRHLQRWTGPTGCRKLCPLWTHVCRVCVIQRSLLQLAWRLLQPTDWVMPSGSGLTHTNTQHVNEWGPPNIWQTRQLFCILKRPLFKSMFVCLQFPCQHKKKILCCTHLPVHTVTRSLRFLSLTLRCDWCQCAFPCCSYFCKLHLLRCPHFLYGVMPLTVLWTMLVLMWLNSLIMKLLWDTAFVPHAGPTWQQESVWESADVERCVNIYWMRNSHQPTASATAWFYD